MSNLSKKRRTEETIRFKVVFGLIATPLIVSLYVYSWIVIYQ